MLYNNKKWFTALQSHKIKIVHIICVVGLVSLRLLAID